MEDVVPRMRNSELTFLFLYCNAEPDPFCLSRYVQNAVSMKRIANYNLWVVYLLAAITTVSLGCSRNNEPKTLSEQDTTERITVSTEGFSFLYTGAIPMSFSEAPELTKLVEEGKLPPVEDRLPEEPLVIPPIERIGQYGGTWRRGFTGAIDRQNIDQIMHDHLIYYELDGQTLMPHIAKGWEISEGGTTFTFHLRKGMKWSDGMPFTADDFVFAYEELTLNDELNPAKASYLKADGKLCQMEKLDDYTVRYIFHQPNYSFIEKVASLIGAGQSARQFDCPLYAPRHYLMQYLPKYISSVEMDRKIKAFKMASWVRLFMRMSRFHENPDLPVVGPWKTVTPITGDVFSLERNAYYFAVDPEGNQLPYIDRIVMHLVEDMEVFNTRVISGAVDMQHRHILLDKIPVLKREAKKGNYRVLLWPNLGGSDAAVFVNQTWQGDPEIEKLMRNLDFRIALSLAIDRDEINESIFLGIGQPRTFIPPPGHMFYPGPEYENKYIERDLVKANEILDRIGLEKKAKNGYRLRTDRKEPLIISLAVLSRTFLNFEGIGELVVNHWKDIGINVQLKVEERSLFFARVGNNDQQLTLWTEPTPNPWAYPLTTVPINRQNEFAPFVGMWYATDGKKGTAPTGGLKQLLDIFDHGNSIPLEKRGELGKELWRVHVDNLYVIGIVGGRVTQTGPL